MNRDNLKLATEINVVNIFPNEVIKYNKETQTVNTFEYSGNDSIFAEENESTDDGEPNHNTTDSEQNRPMFRKSKLTLLKKLNSFCLSPKFK